MNAQEILSMGKFQDVIDSADKYIECYTTLLENENLPSIKASRIDALIHPERIVQADPVLMDPALRGNWVAHIEIRRFEAKIGQLKKRGDVASIKYTDSSIIPEGANRQDLLDTLKAIVGTRY